MFWKLLWILFLLSFSAGVHADASNDLTWVPDLETGFVIDLSYPLCPNSTGNSTITAGVVGVSSGNTVVDANVFATIQKPDLTTTDINFTNDLSGTYTATFNFDQNGTYLIQAHAYQTGATMGDVNGFVYLGPLSWTSAFLDDGFTIDVGELADIRNTVTNADGNLVYDINVNTTIYYPDGSVADANATMSQIPNGEWVRSFFGPSPAGTYSVATIYKCGTKFVWDDSGSFITTSTDDGGSGGGGGSSGDSGGGAGGGGGGGVKKAEIELLEFVPALSKNAPSQMKVTVKNNVSEISDYTIHYVITSPSNVVTSGSKNILDVGPLNTTTIVANSSYTALETGPFIVELKLTNLTGLATYDQQTETVLVTGEHALTLDVQPVSDETALGLTFPFTLNLFNNGDYLEENVEIEWFVLDPNGEEYIHSNSTTSLTKGETKSFSYSPFIPLTSALGLHELIVQIHAYGVTHEEKVLFSVSSPTDYYAELIVDLELRIDQLDDKIDSLADRGFDVKEESLMLLDIQTALATGKAALLSGKLEGLNTLLIDISEKITKLAAMVDALEQQAPLLSRDGLNLLLYIGAGLLLGLFLWFLLWFIRKEKKKPPVAPLAGPKPVSWLSKLLRVEKTYYSPPEREKQREKPLISGILGLKEKGD